MLCIFTEGSFIPMMTSKRTYVDSPSSLDPVPMPLFLKKSGAIYCLSHGFGFNITGQDCSLLRNYIIHIYKYLSNPISSTINSQCTMISLATIAVNKPCNDSTLNKFYPSEDMDESCEYFIQKLSYISRFTFCDEYVRLILKICIN